MIGNSATRYGAVTKALHWSMAAGILAMIPLGIFAADAPFATADELAQKAWMFSLHKTIGVALFFLALIRIAWAISQPKPAPLHPDRPLETFLAELVHWMVYVLLVTVPLSGWIHHAASQGFAPIWWPFGQSLPLIPKSETLSSAAAGAHGATEMLLVISLFLHIAGAVKHHVVDRDATLRRMLPGKVDAGVPGKRSHHATPAVLAIGAVVAAMGLGGANKIDSVAAPAINAPQLEAAISDWQVQDGTLALSVQQFGQTVEGQFADWMAEISFDETVAEGPAGSVTVVVAIPSLTLGTVTDQAMGPDFFDAAQFGTATFTSQILAGPEGYTAPGTLTLKTTESPLTLSLQISVSDGVATATGEATVDRRAFGIGDAMTDPGQLGFEVPLSISVTAVHAK